MDLLLTLRKVIEIPITHIELIIAKEIERQISNAKSKVWGTVSVG
jgi:hypothetical protein